MCPNASLCEPEPLLKRYGWWVEEAISKSQEQKETHADRWSSRRESGSKGETTRLPRTPGGAISLCGTPEWLRGLENVTGTSTDIEGDRKWDFTLVVMFIMGNESFRKMIVIQAASKSF